VGWSSYLSTDLRKHTYIHTYYGHKRKFPKIAPVATWGLRAATVVAAVGVFQFNTNDIGTSISPLSANDDILMSPVIRSGGAGGKGLGSVGSSVGLQAVQLSIHSSVMSLKRPNPNSYSAWISTYATSAAPAIATTTAT
jgi:CybS, succinate dehydrogenase cytochrome B small subunit